jgi:TolA-binding protein
VINKKTFPILLFITVTGICLELSSQEFSDKTPLPAEANSNGKTVEIIRNRQRVLGEKAFKDNDFQLAVTFFLRYKEEVKDKPDELKDAFECLITSYIRALNPESASRELKEYLKRFPNQDKKQADFYRAEIFMAGSKFESAEKIYSELVETTPKTMPEYYQALAGLGASLIQQQKWAEAIKTYHLLEHESKTTKWEFIALEQKIYCLIMAGELKKAQIELLSFPKFNHNPSVADLKFLNILILAKDKRLAEIETVYKNVRQNIKEESYPLLYATDILIAKAFIAEKSYDNAVPYLKDAFIFSPSKYGRQKALRQLIDTYILCDKKDEAVASAEKYLKYYQHAQDTVNIRILMAKLFTEQGKTSEALKIYDDLINDSFLDFPAKVTAAKLAAKIFIDQKDYKSAASKLNEVFSKSNDDYIQGEGQYLLSELLFLQGDYQTAVASFIKTADKFKDWQEKSLYMAMRCYINLNEYDKALAIAENISKTFPKSTINVEITFWHAIILYRKGDKDKALNEFIDFAGKHPKHSLTPEALFYAGRIAMDQKNYAGAEKLFSEIISIYPDSSLCANALYRRMITFYFLDDIKAAASDVKQLKKDYPDSKFTLNALFWLVDLHRERKEYAQAEKSLAVLMDFAEKKPEIKAKVLYDLAYVSSKSGNEEKALKYLKDLCASKNIQDNEIVSEALFLTGDIYSVRGDFETAITFYLKAAERRPGSLLEQACFGRIGDCNYSLYSKNFDSRFLLDAVKYYEKILAGKNVSDYIRNQILYKTGKCLETAGEDNKALAKYKEVIYGFSLNKDNSKNIKPIWVVKSANAAIALYRKQDTPEAGRKAIKIYNFLIENKLGPVEDYRKIIDSLESEYKL